MAGRRRRSVLRLDMAESPNGPQMIGNGSSPMTNLSNIMGGLSCLGDTPRRRLSLTSGDTPTTTPLSRNSSQSSGISVSSPDPEDYRIEGIHSSRTNLSLRRFHSNPSSFNSPLFSQPSESTAMVFSSRLPKKGFHLESPDEESEVVFYSSGVVPENESKDRQVPQSMNSDQSSSFTSIRPLPDYDFSKPRPISAPASLLNQSKVPSRIVEEDDSVQLQHSLLTSSNDDEEDDGFCDIFDSDSQEASAEEPLGLNGLLNNPIIGGTQQPSVIPDVTEVLTSPPLQPIDCNAMDITPEPKCRRGIFKVPSHPALKKSNSFLKRPERPKDTPSPIMKKKARSMSAASPSSLQNGTRVSMQKKCLMRSLSSAAAGQCKSRIEQKLSQDAEGLNLIGDGSTTHFLPIISGCHKDLKTITPEMLAKVVRREFSDDVEEFFIVDARYPYEFKGGHIKGAINLYNKEGIDQFFLNHPMQKLDKRRLVIFHCEFSSKRAPSLLKYLREEDRNANMENYPYLYYPELYLLHGGYKNFFENCEVLCEPQCYTPMLHKDHSSDFKHFKTKAKSWSGGTRLKFKNRSLSSHSSSQQ